MLYILFAIGLVVCSYIVCIPFVNRVHEVPITMMVQDFGEYILYGLLAELVLITLFSVTGGIIGLIGYSVILFLHLSNVVYSNWD